MCVVEDDKVSIEDLIEKITEENEDLVKKFFFVFFLIYFLLFVVITV